MASQPATQPVHRILVTGWRDWPAELADYIYLQLAVEVGQWAHTKRPVVIVEGECPYGGADRWAREYGEANGHIVEKHPADWDRHGRSAGHLRNTEMVNAGANVCLAFPGPKSRGTRDCLLKAIEAGIETRVYPVAAARRWLERRNRRPPERRN